MKKYLIVFFLFGIVANNFSQNRVIDSLKTVLKSCKEDTNKVNTLKILTQQYLNTGNYDTARVYANRGLKLSEYLGFLKGNAYALNHIGTTYFYQADHPRALNYYFKSLKIAEKISNNKIISNNFITIAFILSEQGDFDNALIYLEKAIKINEEIGDKKSLATILANTGNVYNAKKKYSNALEYYYKSMKMREELNDTSGYEYAIILSNVGMAYSQLNDFPNALVYLFKALEMTKALNIRVATTNITLNIGETYAKLKNYKKAEEYYLMGLKIADEINALETIKDINFSLSELYEKENKFQLSLECYKKYTIVNDSIYSETKSKQIAEMQTKYEVAKKDKEVLELKSKEQVAKAEKQKDENKKNFLIAISILSLLLIVVLILRQKKQKEANRIKQQLIQSELSKSKLEAKNLEATLVLNQEKLNNYTQQIKDKTELLEKMQQQLENNSQLVLGEKGVEELLNNIQEDIDPNEYWEKFITTFNLVHKGFFDKLTENYPILSRTELRLCAFIKCNLGNKEIANVLNLTHNYVKTACSRLGKKMNLEEEQNLRQFILESF